MCRYLAQSTGTFHGLYLTDCQTFSGGDFSVICSADDTVTPVGGDMWMSSQEKSSLNWFVQKHWFIQEPNKGLSLWGSHSIVHSTSSFKNADSFGNKTSDRIKKWIRSESFLQRIGCVVQRHTSVQLFCGFVWSYFR